MVYEKTNESFLNAFVNDVISFLSTLEWYLISKTRCEIKRMKTKGIIQKVS